MKAQITLDDVTKDLEGQTKMFAQCCVCNRYRLDNGEFTAVTVEYLETQQPYVISHTYCHPCAKKSIEDRGNRRFPMYQNHKVILK